MLLALDVGNTNIVVGCMEGKTLLRAFRLATRRDSTGGDYAAAISQLLELAGISRQDVEQIIISSVVPQVTRALQGTALLLTGKEPLVLGQNVRCDLPVLIDQPETLGADLLAAAVGALDQFRPPLLLIDMGTATTVTVVDENGAFRGGAILPGANLSLAALYGNTALLPDIPLYAKRLHPGRGAAAGRHDRPHGGRAGPKDHRGGHRRHRPVYHPGLQAPHDPRRRPHPPRPRRAV